MIRRHSQRARPALRLAGWFGRQEPLVKVMVLCAVAFAVLVFLALVALPIVEAAPADGSQPPAAITAAVRLTAVYCAGPCCCGTAQTIYRGRWYDRPRGYCRWFRPLAEGQVVTTTLYLVR